jgi:hypothetical protein
LGESKNITILKKGGKIWKEQKNVLVKIADPEQITESLIIQTTKGLNAGLA